MLRVSYWLHAPFVAAVLLVAFATRAEPVRLGWQTPWATQGQVVQAMRRTNVLELVGQDVSFVGFTYGAPLNAAALAGQVDMLLTADQPALVLLARAPQFRIVARLMYNRACVYVPPLSPVRSVADLGGQTLMGPSGAAAERIARAALTQFGVDATAVKFGHLDMAQQVPIVQRGDARRWSGVDAMYGFDPLPAEFEERGLARMIHCGPIVAVVLASGEMLERRTAELRRVLAALALAWYWYANHTSLANSWFLQESRLDVSPSALDHASAMEPNIRVRRVAEVQFAFTERDLTDLRQTADFLHVRGILTHRIDPREFISTDLAMRVLADPALTDMGRGLAAKR